MDETERQNSTSLGRLSDERLNARFDRASRIDDETKAKIQDFSTKALMGSGAEGGSYAGLRLNGAAHSAILENTTFHHKDGKSVSRLLLELVLRENLEAMSEALDDYIEKLSEEIAVLEIERDELVSGIEQLESELQSVEERVATAQKAIDRIEAGGEPELDESGSKLKDSALEKLISEYEKAHGTQIDRGDSALLLAILRKNESEFESKSSELEKRIFEKKSRLDEVRAEITERENAIGGAEGFKSEFERISAIMDDADRERQLEVLLENAPKPLLSHLVKSDRLSDEAKKQIEEYRMKFAEEPAESDFDAKAFLSESSLEGSDAEITEAASVVPPKPLG